MNAIFSAFHGSRTQFEKQKIGPPCACSTRPNPKSSRPSIWCSLVLQQDFERANARPHNRCSSSMKNQDKVESNKAKLQTSYQKCANSIGKSMFSSAMFDFGRMRSLGMRMTSALDCHSSWETCGGFAFLQLATTQN